MSVNQIQQTSFLFTTENGYQNTWKVNNVSYSEYFTWRRYVGIFVDMGSGTSVAGKVITQLDIEAWAKHNDYVIERSFRLWGPIDPTKEKTELIY